ncbi:hypothetical protein AXK57_11145 [Tsukamurella pulmonis]|uniref:hypothetical protein n=1 Tax=Tsukamurella pulmonis TaxID=47312 RepID=UPI00079C69C3|nr:hypothetical protein [Tsukamurella pulmonis]KXP09439.1 hypothetical protein AXK57_11145 [Tsukamurella pulmonis]RDH12130.1 hypothetical protein DVB88_09245 [Tsukamurella pulmonis]
MTQPGDDQQPPTSAPTTPPTEPIDAELVDLPPAGSTAPSYEEVTGYTPAGVPTFDHIRDKIERRTTTALGAEELAHGTAAGQDAERAFADREKAAKAKLEEIRRSMGS